MKAEMVSQHRVNLQQINRLRKPFVVRQKGLRASPAFGLPLPESLNSVDISTPAKKQKSYEHRLRKCRQYDSERRKNKPIESRASRILRYNVERGKIKKPCKCSSCGIENKRIIGHHEDYSKPLEVIWLCNGCHLKRHTHWRNKLQNMIANPLMAGAKR